MDEDELGEVIKMKIISIRRGFTPDHSSTSYEFLAVDKALGKKEKAEVASLSRRARPTSRRVSFSYNVEGYDIPGGWEKLMQQYYDVMYSESYDWWTFALAFDTTEEQIEELHKYEFFGKDDLGVKVEDNGKRAIIIINCRVDAAYLEGLDDEYENEEDTESKGEKGVIIASDNPLLNLLIQMRQQIINKDYRVLYAVWQKYGGPEYVAEEEYDIPVPEDKETGKHIIEQFKNILDE